MGAPPVKRAGRRSAARSRKFRAHWTKRFVAPGENLLSANARSPRKSESSENESDALTRSDAAYLNANDTAHPRQNHITESPIRKIRIMENLFLPLIPLLMIQG
jgi:hypothetical protein